MKFFEKSDVFQENDQWNANEGDFFFTLRYQYHQILILWIHKFQKTQLIIKNSIYY